MSVSVPIATYDRINIVATRTLPALLAQTHSDVEVVIVGDGTPLNLWDGLRNVASERVTIKRLRRRTRYPKSPLERWMVAGWKPRRRAARLSTGDWILWMSDDDIILEDGIESLLQVVREWPEVEVVTGPFFVGTERQLVRSPEERPSGLPMVASGMPAMLVRSDLKGVAWNRHSWRKKWNRPSDYDLMERLHRAGVRWGTTEKIVALIPEVEGTGLIGSKAFELEELRRRNFSQHESGRSET